VQNSIGQAYNIGNQSPEVTIEEIAKNIIKVVGKELKINPMPETAGSPARRCPDMTKTFEAIGYKSKTDLYSGIRKTFEWYKENVFIEKGISAI
jgi:nucleoside-diphosphate-sugar epimerase